MEFEKIENSIGYTFKNKELLKKALTHTSYAYENCCCVNDVKQKYIKSPYN